MTRLSSISLSSLLPATSPAASLATRLAALFVALPSTLFSALFSALPSTLFSARFSARFLAVFTTMLTGLLLAGCGSKGPNPATSLSYQGHENDSDSRYLLAAYPGAAGTRLDDCQTCHRGGQVTYRSGKISTLNPCSYCHLVPYPDQLISIGVPRNYQATLNPFGLDYKNAGRSVSALHAIAGADSDGDTHSNRNELNALRYPGDAGSQPGQQSAPTITVGMNELAGHAPYDQFLLMNSHSQQYDSYARYTGVKVMDLLKWAGVDLAGSTSITFIAPDGFAKDFDLEELDSPYPDGLYYADLDPGSFAEPRQGVVKYAPADQLLQELTDGGVLPGEQWVLIAYERDGSPLKASHLDAASGRLVGEGPYRLIVPQGTPGAPDRGSDYSPSGYEDGYDYDDEKDHNAGLCVRAVVAIRVNSVPDGYEEFDWKNSGMSLLARKQLIIYGAGVAAD